MATAHDKATGLVFWHVSTTMNKKVDGTRMCRIVLDCEVHNEEVLAGIEKKFHEGYHVAAGEDFHVGVIDAMRAELEVLRNRNSDLERQLRQTADAKGLVEKELQQYKEPLSTFGRVLRGG